ncbi:laccase-4-like [Chenopodium quinoa]|uniref:Laccase n=1 Tax=Chenopodium quinoa TaxID=63459 RepID=A0A803M3N7_CHEQI|nr:laccase-4-like [Chenopodium quinoa]
MNKEVPKSREGRMERWIHAVVILLMFPALAEATVRHYNFKVVMKNYTKLCSTKAIATVNGKFPGPTLHAREGDNVLVKVINNINYNVTIHWHGIRQLKTGWSDGPAYVAQCPIQPEQSYLYNFTIIGQRGTLFWHAHISWLRATLHGAIVILPKKGTPYPFPHPVKEKVIVLGEWWKADTEAVINQATQSGMPPNVSDSHIINGHTGPVRNCSISTQGTYTLHVEHNKTYLLRIINAAINDEVFFRIAGHKFTVVEVDASYTKPFTTDTIYIAPGQTTNALLKADQSPTGKYLIGMSSFMDAPVAVDNTTTYGLLRYKGGLANSRLVLTTMPPLNATQAQLNFTHALRSLNSRDYPAKVPLDIDHSLFFTMGVGVNPCPTCLNGSKLVGSINNVTFVMPTISLLQAHYYKIKGVFTDDFPGKPLTTFNYTTNFTGSLATVNGTKVYRLPFNATVQVVLQDTSLIAPESHPLHLHGFNFFVVGMGIGNYDDTKDPESFNLVDPVERNTIDVPTGGWTAIRFRADNPGVWFMHCHLEVHTSWGLKMAFLIENGDGPNESIVPPPKDLPKC